MKRRLPKLSVRRRSATEQRVLRMLRGDTKFRDPTYETQFTRLRKIAQRNALVIHPSESPFLSSDELRLLGWLAQGQRVLGYRQQFHQDAMLTITIVHCAGTLDALGLNLPPITMDQNDLAVPRAVGVGG